MNENLKLNVTIILLEGLDKMWKSSIFLMKLENLYFCFQIFDLQKNFIKFIGSLENI